MKRMICLLFLLPAIASCRDSDKSRNIEIKADPQTLYSSIEDISLPPGFQRIKLQPGSFGEWLRTIRLKKNSTVYLYNGRPKDWQGAQFAVLDMPIGNKDLQQCADAVMRLRAEYFFQKQLEDKISFHGGNGVEISFQKWMKGERYKTSGNKLVAYQTGDTVIDKRKAFDSYLETVFIYCGTYSLAYELKKQKA